jgi:hypothetical protein
VLQALLESLSASHLPNIIFKRGFHVTGIYPLNENIVGEDEFLSSFVTDRTLQSGDRTSQCSFKFQGQQRKGNISWIYDSVP